MIMTVASVVIPTVNRDDELAVCLRSLRQQSVALEVIVMDDGPGPRTQAIVEACFPGARYVHVASRKGPAFQRSEGIRLASHDIVFPLDDDTEIIDPLTIERSMEDFADARVAAVGIPFVNVRISSVPQQTASVPGRADLIHAFVGASHAIRRSAFLEVGGYREHFFYMGEESDLCIRLLEKGYRVRTGSAPPIHHFESPYRDSRMAAVCGRKNDVLFCWHNVPHPYFLPHLITTIVKGCTFGWRNGHALWHLEGTLTGLRECFGPKGERSPVSRRTYRLFRHLKKFGPVADDAPAGRATIPPASMPPSSPHEDGGVAQASRHSQARQPHADSHP